MSSIRVVNPWSMISPVWDDMTDMTNRMLGTFPAMNVYEENDMVHAEMEVPGYKMDDLEISITGDVLKITGKSEDKTEQKQGRRYYMTEVSEKSFTRTVTLPYEVTAEEAKASLVNGMLRLVMPKSEKAKPKTIQITAE